MSAFGGHGIDDIQNRDAAIRGLARRLVSNEHDLEDVVQDTWLAAIEQPGGRVRNIDGWLRTVVRYTASRKRRRDAQRLHRELRVGEERLDDETALPDEPSPDALSTLTWAIGSLRDPYRTVIHLRYFEGLSIADICAHLERPPATVKSQLRRAMQQLRDRMDREYGGERELWKSALVVALRLDPSGEAAAPLATAGSGSAAGSSVLAWLGAGTAVAAVLVAAWLLPEPTDEAPPAPEIARTAPPSTDRASSPSDDSAASRSSRVAAETTPAPAPVERADPVRSTPRHEGPGLVKITARSADESPAVELPILIEPVSRHLLASTEPLIDLVDQEGVWSGRLPQGEWRVSPMRGDARTFHVDSAQLELDLTIPEGILLGGLVADPLGKPLSGATIQGSWPGRRDVWLPLDLSDLSGTYEVVVDPQAWVYATDAGRSPSPIHSVRRSARGSSEPILLELGFVRPTIAGFVVDANGDPVSGATVGTAVLPSLGIQLGRDGTWWTNRMPTRSTTDDRGRFGVDRVNPTTNQIVVTAAGMTPWRGTLPPGLQMQPMRVQLDEANHVVGRVVDEEGVAVAGAWIEIEQVWPFGPKRALTDADGEFRISELAPGDVTVKASADEVGSVVVKRAIDAAETLEVTLSLSDAATVAGRALGSHGEPLSDWLVALVLKRDLDEREALPVDEVWREAPVARTDRRGAFRFLACDPEEHVALLFPPQTGSNEVSGLPQAWRAEVYPGEERVELALREEASANATLAGVLDCSPSSSHSTKVLLRSVELNHAIVGELDRSCGFRFEGLPPGDYELFAWKPSRPPVRVAEVALEPEAEVDLDRVRLPVDGALRIQVTTPGGASLQDMVVQLVSRYARFQGMMLQPTNSFDIQPDGTVYVRDLPPGEYHLRMETMQFADVYDRIVIEEGSEAYQSYELSPGREFLLRVTSTVPLQPHERIDFSIIPENGGPPIPFDGFQPTVPQGPFLLSLRFPEGAYRIAARSSSGLEGENRLLLSNGGPRRVAVDLSLGR